MQRMAFNILQTVKKNTTCITYYHVVYELGLLLTVHYNSLRKGTTQLCIYNVRIHTFPVCMRVYAH